MDEINEIKLEKLASLLSKPFWKICDIEQYVGCKRTKASHIKKEAEFNFGGNVKFSSSLVLRDAVILSLGLKIENEIHIIKQISEFIYKQN